jgi:hypothetical protein
MKPQRSIGLLSTADNQIAWQRQISRVLSRNVSFGDGSNVNQAQNLDGFWVLGVVTPGTANTQFAVPYSLPDGRIAIAFDVKRINAAGTVYDSGTPWTASNIFLKCSAVSVTITLFIH